MLVQKYILYTSNQASSSHFLNLQNTHLELGIAVHTVIQAMGQENCHLARATVNITLVKTTLWDFSENKQDCQE